MAADKDKSLLTVEDVQRLAIEAETERAQEAIEKAREHDHTQREMHEAFMTADVRPDAMQWVSRAVTLAARDGRREVLGIKFPASYCRDGGRAINNFEPDWPETLEGQALRAYQWYEEHLRPAGYKVRAQILNYPDGIPGDVGLFIVW